MLKKELNQDEELQRIFDRFEELLERKRRINKIVQKQSLINKQQKSSRTSYTKHTKKD